MFITISRQYAAGGSRVAKLVADALGWTVVDDEFIDQLSQRSGYAPDDVASLEERVPSFLERLAQSSALSYPEALISTPEIMQEPGALRLARLTRELVSELGRRDRLVFVGRATAAVLERDEGTLHCRVVASKAHRVRVAIEVLGVDEREAKARVETIDRNRADYHREYYDRDWTDPVNYHMVLNTELLGLEGAAEVIVGRARAMGW